MKTKIILFDIDGVIVRPPYYFWRVLEERWYENAEEILNNFFIHENTECTEWKADISEKIVPYLEKIWWEKSVADFFTEQFEFEAQYFDSSFIERVKKFQEKWILCYLASAQESIRAQYFLEEFWFARIFDGHYISCNVWYRKDKAEYWEYVLWDIQENFPQVTREEILFIDDGKKNISMAQSFSVKTFLFTDIEAFEENIEI